MRYNWQRKDWPNFKYDTEGVEEALFDFATRAGRISGMLEGLTKIEQTEAIINLMVAEAMKTSEIEGEYLSRKDVLSSIRRKLGLHPHFPPTRDLRAQGVAELMLAVRHEFNAPLTERMLFSWHAMLLKGTTHMVIGAWRTHAEPMQIVSGAMGREVVHFEAPPSSQVPDEMDRFISWFNTSEKEFTKPVIRAALAHLYFESIHPFEDGNGRIGRAIAEKALSQNLQCPVLFSLSRSIESNKKAYYEQLQQAQRSNEITDWIAYFTRMIQGAQIEAEQEITFTLRKTRFFDTHKGNVNPRQEKAVKRMLEEGPKGFEGGMNARKYVSITGASSATATRDLKDLVNKGIFKAVGGGRSSRYELFL